MATKTWTRGRSFFLMGAALAATILVDQVVGCMSAAAQQRSGASTTDADAPGTVDTLIRQMSQSAGVIFVGTVLAVRYPEGVAGSPADASRGAVAIDFRVDQAVAGTQAGSLYTLREWAGLWVGGAERYRVGERRLMLLHSSGSSGFASPVHGPEGAIPLRGTGSSPGPYDSSTSGSQWMVDVRWLQAQTMRSQIRLAVPVRGPIPGRRGDPYISEGVDPLLARAQPSPWIDLTGSTDAVRPGEQVESLAHVLFLCTHPAESQDEQP